MAHVTSMYCLFPCDKGNHLTQISWIPMQIISVYSAFIYCVWCVSIFQSVFVTLNDRNEQSLDSKHSDVDLDHNKPPIKCVLSTHLSTM